MIGDEHVCAVQWLSGLQSGVVADASQPSPAGADSGMYKLALWSPNWGCSTHPQRCNHVLMQVSPKLQ